MRIALYGRRSTDLQSQRSVADQFALCRDFAARQFSDAEIVGTYSDEAVSGSSLDRPGVQKMLRDARQKKFNLVLFESLNRLSRDMADATTVKKEFDFNGIELWAVNGGKLDTMRTGLESLMGQMFREETAQKVMRGMRPRASEGLHMGGRPYGYKPLMEETRNIDDKGKLKVDEIEAAVILRILEEYVGGMKPRMIAAGLNRDGIPSPRGGKWNASTINGQLGRGVGILHNELYVGRYRWNKQTFKKPPGSNKRVSRINQASLHTLTEVPEYRIVPQELWDKAQAILAANQGVHMSRQRTPPRLLSQLIRCPACGGGMGSVGKDKTGKIRIACSTDRESKTCPEPHKFYLEWVEETVLTTLAKGLAEPKVVQRAIKAYEEQRRQSAAKAISEIADIEKRINDLTRSIARLTQMLINEIGDEEGNSAAVKAFAAEKRQLEEKLEAIKRQTPDNVIELHAPAMKRYLDALGSLQRSIERRTLAGDLGPALVLREFIEAVYVHPAKDGKPKYVEVKGKLAQLLGWNAETEQNCLLDEPRSTALGGKGGSGGGI